MLERHDEFGVLLQDAIDQRKVHAASSPAQDAQPRPLSVFIVK
jgi:hypothetical protein